MELQVRIAELGEDRRVVLQAEYKCYPNQRGIKEEKGSLVIIGRWIGLVAGKEIAQ